jgi:Exportin 1-like protein
MSVPGAVSSFDVDAQTASLELVKEAIRCLYAASTAAPTRASADQFLQRFQTTQQAWAISDALLSENPFEGSEAYQRVFFGAITMHNKIRYDFKDVPDSLIPNLRDTLLKHIARLNDGLVAVAAATAAATAAAGVAPLPAPKISVGMVRKLVSRLCLSYAALVVQSNESGESVIGSVGQAFSPATHGHILLEVLAALPDEGTSERVMGKTQRRQSEFLHGLKSMSPFVLPLIDQMLGVAASTGNTPLISTCFRCFGAWSLYVGLDSAGVAASPIIDFVVRAVAAGPDNAGNAALSVGTSAAPVANKVPHAASSDLWDMAYNTLQDLIRCYSWEEPGGRHLPVLGKLVPGIVGMTTLFDKASEEEDDDILTSLSYLFTEAARKSLYGLILKDHSSLSSTASAGAAPLPPGTAAAAVFDHLRDAVMQTMIKVTAHKDDTIGSKPFPFWIDLGRGFRKMVEAVERETRYSFYSDAATLASAPPHVQQRIRSVQAVRAFLVPVIESLTGVFIQRLKYPDEFDGLESDRKDFFRHTYRYDVADVLAECCCVILDGPAVINILHQRLSKEVQAWAATGNTSKGWEGTEAALYALRCIHRVIPANEGVVMPYVFSMLPSLPLLEHPDLRATAFRIVDKFHYWLKHHAGSHLGSMSDFVIRYGLLPHPDAVPTAPAAPGLAPTLPITLPQTFQENACLAINRLGCEFPIELRDQLLALPSRVNLLCLQRENALQVTMAIMQAVFCLDANQHEAALASLLGPIVALLQRVAADPAVAVQTAAADGTLLASMVTRDALFDRDTCIAFRTTESALQALLNEARSRHGPFTFNPSSLSVETAAAFLVCSQVSRLAEICYDVGKSKSVYVRNHDLHDPKEGTPEDLALSKHQQETIPLPSPSQASSMQQQPLPPGERRRRRIEEAAFASSMSIEASLLRLFEALWPSLAGVAGVMKGNKSVRHAIMRVLNSHCM